MHLLATKPGEVGDGSAAVDLAQSPGDIIVLSAADTEIACLAAAQRARIAEGADSVPSLRLANLMRLSHNLSVDLYVQQTVRGAKLVVVRLLGGRSYWRYGVDEITATCRKHGVPVAFLPGDDQPDAELDNVTTLPHEAADRLWRYLVQGGIFNATQFLAYAGTLINHESDWQEPSTLMRAGLYWAHVSQPDLCDLRRIWQAADLANAPVAALVFYRALLQAGNLAAVDALMTECMKVGLRPLPLHATSLRDSQASAIIRQQLADTPPDIILNMTGFAVSKMSAPGESSPFNETDCPVLQVVFSGGNEEQWRNTTNGLSPRDIAMNVALPEMDGRVLARAVSFKSVARRDDLTQADIVTYTPVPDRIKFTARLAANWCRLRATPTPERRIALVLANYPNRDGRMGNGVGLDTPAATLNVLQALDQAGYKVAELPPDGNALMRRLGEGATNMGFVGRKVRETLPRSQYDTFFAALPQSVRERIRQRWGEPTSDPLYMKDADAFAVPALPFGNVTIGLQPARGYNIDPAASYHDPELVPPHGYLAFHAWLRESFSAHAIVHMGKHGNLEWLPGKALALSEECFPEAALGPMPHLYPFIVNDPGEGSQAKRRAQAVIIDHLTPPLTRAECYGPLRDLEQLVDEYYEAATLDPRRVPVLRRDILQVMQSAGLDQELGVTTFNNDSKALGKLDTYLCELKEMQIRDGLHVFGITPRGRLLIDLLLALARLPRGTTKSEASLTRALSDDLQLSLDPLDCELGAPWTGARPEALTGAAVWRSTGDTVERLEHLARQLIAGESTPDPEWSRTKDVLDSICTTLRPNVERSGAAEMAGLLSGLDGRFVAPGPSGAPTSGRADVLPTGRNFYSVDTRTVPTPAAWQLGWKSAMLLVEQHAHDHGDWPRTIALSAWGTSNMRTGGDDIAQAMALIGVRPTWDTASRRVTGFEILPVSILDRPRVDVTLRVSGFFRDAFPNLIELFDAAVRAVAALSEESAESNPIAGQVFDDKNEFIAAGMSPADAERRATWRVFGSKPGAYGAGLQALIDEHGWCTDTDFARAYVAWGGFAYGTGVDGIDAHTDFERRLASVEAVLHNQDNREHDLLDSDDYYQFEGGLVATVRKLSGNQPVAYHNDHSRPFAPKIRTLEEEVARVVRARVINPKWIAGVMRHGYKGAFEMAATVDYLFAFAATAHCVHNYQFDLVYDAYLGDEKVRSFIAEHNPAVLKEIAARFLEAEDRGLWQPRSNSAHLTLAQLAETTP